MPLIRFSRVSFFFCPFKATCSIMESWQKRTPLLWVYHMSRLFFFFFFFFFFLFLRTHHRYGCGISSVTIAIHFHILCIRNDDENDDDNNDDGDDDGDDDKEEEARIHRMMKWSNDMKIKVLKFIPFSLFRTSKMLNHRSYRVQENVQGHILYRFHFFSISFRFSSSSWLVVRTIQTFCNTTIVCIATIFFPDFCVCNIYT